jgi:hypothetical protein
MAAPWSHATHGRCGCSSGRPAAPHARRRAHADPGRAVEHVRSAARFARRAAQWRAAHLFGRSARAHDLVGGSRGFQDDLRPYPPPHRARGAERPSPAWDGPLESLAVCSRRPARPPGNSVPRDGIEPPTRGFSSVADEPKTSRKPRPFRRFGPFQKRSAAPVPHALIPVTKPRTKPQPKRRGR